MGGTRRYPLYRMSYITSRLDRSRGLLPGDVVYDKATFKPMQVVRLNGTPASEVPDVWDNELNRVYYGVQEDSDTVDVVFLPKGDRPTVPSGTQTFPVERIQRIPIERADNSRRPQAHVTRAVLAHLLAEVRNADGDEAHEAAVAALERMFSEKYATEISEWGDSIALD